MIAKYASLLTAISALASAGLVLRTVTELDQAAFGEAQQRDDTAVRAFSNTEIKTSDGRCLFVDELSGDFRANLTPIQIATCGTTTGQGWDIITQGTHNNGNGSVLVVSTLTQACFNYDPLRAAGNQVILFSCGGRADGSGDVTDSQLFAANGGAGPLSLAPENEAGSCLSVDGSVIGIAACQAGNADQSFTFGDTVSDSEGVVRRKAASTSCTLPASATTVQQAAPTALPAFTFTGICEAVTVTATVTVTASPSTVSREVTSASSTTTVFVTVTPAISATGDVAVSSTTTIFVTVAPAASSSTGGITISSTTTVYVTVGQSSTSTARQSAATTATTAKATTQVATSKAIPRVSIGPSTTAVL